jgi:hypothetical protein
MGLGALFARERLPFWSRESVDLPKLVVAFPQALLALASEHSGLALSHVLHGPTVGELELEPLVESRAGPLDDRRSQHVEHFAPTAVLALALVVVAPCLDNSN